MGSFSNDLKLTKTIKLGDTDKLDFTGGLFFNKQAVSLTWNFNQYLMQITGKNPALIATATTPGGVVSIGGANFGFCCQRAIDVDYTTVSPYASVAYESGPLNVDGSIRMDRQNADGSINSAGNSTYKPANAYKVDYSKNRTSFSLGGNYRLTRDIAMFARVSDGASFNADRIFGDLNAKIVGDVPINVVKQAEVGVKARAGALSAFVTLFNARTAESNYEATTQKSTRNSYKANGMAVEAAYLAGDFRLGGGLTLTDAQITASNDASVVGKTPRRQARAVYQLTPSYNAGPLSVGVSLVGTGKSYGNDGNTITMGGYTVINAFVNYQAMKNLVVGVGVNNLANTLGYTEVEGDGHAARAVNGRTVKATLRYSF